MFLDDDIIEKQSRWRLVWSLKIEQIKYKVKNQQFFMSKFLELKWLNFLLRVWSWLRTNAGGVPNTCKSSDEVLFGEWISGGRVSNTWVTCLIEGDSLSKGRLIPHNIALPHDSAIKGVIRYKMDPRRIS